MTMDPIGSIGHSGWPSSATLDRPLSLPGSEVPMTRCSSPSASSMWPAPAAAIADQSAGLHAFGAIGMALFAAPYFDPPIVALGWAVATLLGLANVYFHDTPSKGLFNASVRAFSHGCMRVQNPDQYAEVLLNIGLPNENYTAAKIQIGRAHV